MRFRIEPTDTLPPSPRWRVVNDADVTVALCYWRSWAARIAEALDEIGVDYEPTPIEANRELAEQARWRQARDNADAPIPASPDAEAFRAAAERYMQGGRP